MSAIELDIRDKIATITLNRPKSLNALTLDDYNDLATHLRTVDKRDDVLVTVLQARGRYFCSGTDVKARRVQTDSNSIREVFLTRVTPSNTDPARALYTHSKILVAALNGPVIGIAAAFLGHFDFIYAMPAAWLSVPFTFLGIVAEAGSSVSFVNRMGLSKANEVLLFGKKTTAEEMLHCGFVNKIFNSKSPESFHKDVREHVLDLISGLDPTALLTVKSLIKTGLTEKNNPDGVNLRESYAQAERFSSGIPYERFGRIASKQIKHKL